MSWQNGEPVPVGWTAKPLNSVTKVVGGGTPKTAVAGNFSDTHGHPWITPADLTGYTERHIRRGRRFITDQGLKGSSATYVPADTVLFSSRAPVGYVAIADVPLTTNQGFRSFLPSDELDPEYLYHALRFLRPLAEHLASGTTFSELSGTKAGSMVIAYPDKPVQRQIVERIDRLESGLRDIRSNLVRTRSKLVRLRLSVLRSAFSGALTSDWRSSSRLHDVKETLAQVRGEMDVKRGRRDHVSPPDETDLPDLPDTWAWARVGEVGQVQIGGTPSRKNSDYWLGPVPWVSSGEVANCRISETRELITEAGLNNSSAKLYPAGTVLIAMIGEGKTRGQAAILDIEATTNQNAAGILPDPRIIDPEYLWRWALAEYDTTRAAGRGGNQAALNGQKVRELLIPVPPLREQAEVVRKIDRIVSVDDLVLGKLAAIDGIIEKSAFGVLAKAFRGELVASID